MEERYGSMKALIMQTMGINISASRPPLLRNGAHHLNRLREGSYVVDTQHLAGRTSRLTANPPPPVCGSKFGFTTRASSSHMGDDEFIPRFFHRDQPLPAFSEGAISAPRHRLPETDAENLCVGFGRDAGVGDVGVTGLGCRGDGELGGERARTEERKGGQPSHVDQRDTAEEVEAVEEGLVALSREESGHEAGERGGERGAAAAGHQSSLRRRKRRSSEGGGGMYGRKN
ncbi:hypothetical protein Syun_001249 [Stephania yunnanensis]|uniref:Uncharacterized protein n=1 Tax=Stephania yunnanensis TaxID=152371 RepID=A0AAP0LHG0_9MAGN